MNICRGGGIGRRYVQVTRAKTTLTCVTHAGSNPVPDTTVTRTRSELT